MSLQLLNFFSFLLQVLLHLFMTLASLFFFPAALSGALKSLLKLYLQQHSTGFVADSCCSDCWGVARKTSR